MKKIEPAKSFEAEECYAILDSGRNFQRLQGFIQWDSTYPTLEIVKNDIAAGKGYVLRSGGEIAGYMCIDFDGEPAYDTIKGSWNSDLPYAVIHRLSLSDKFRNKGLGFTALKLIEEFLLTKNITYIRADTDFPNKRMQHLFIKSGYKKCGTIEFCGEKVAYDKIIKR